MRNKPDIIVITDKGQSDLSLELQLQEAGFLRIGFYSSREELVKEAQGLEYPLILLEGISIINFDIFQLDEAQSHNCNICAVKLSKNNGQKLIELDDDLNIVRNIARSEDHEDGYISGNAYLLQGYEALSDMDFSQFFWKGLPMSFREDYLTSSHYRRALLLDRDGIINVDTKYLYKIEDVEIYPDIVPIIKYFNERNLPVCVITNQSGVAREMYSEEDVVKLHKEMGKLLVEMGCEVNGWYYSPFHEKGKGKYKKVSLLRKPFAGMALQAAEDFPIRLSESIMIGDKSSDYLHLNGTKTIHIQRGEDLSDAKGLIVNSLKEALIHIVSTLE